MMQFPTRTALSLALVAALASGNAVAQQPSQQQQDAQSSAGQLDTITVTARKRAENIVEVPMNITAVTSTELTARNVNTVQDVYRSLAGAASPTGQLILRGLAGGNSASPGTTSQFVDGIPLGFSNVFDVERMEVLRGPQGTLWGSNAIGGTVQIVTTRPNTQEMEVFGSVRASSEKDVSGVGMRYQLGFNAPLVENTLALRVVGSHANLPQQIVNAATGTQSNRTGEFLRAQLQWEPTEDFRANLGYMNIAGGGVGTTRADRSKQGFYRTTSFTPNPDSDWGYDVDYGRVTCDPNWERPACFTGGNTGVSAPDKYTIYELMDGWYKDKTDLFSLRFDHDDLFGIASMSYVGSWRTYKGTSLDNWSRLDMDDMMKTWIINDEASSRVTHELRFQNNERMAGFNWTVGAFLDRYWEPNNPNRQWQYHENTPTGVALFSDWNDWAWDESWWDQGIHNVAELGQVLYGDPSKNYNLTNIHTLSKERALFGEVNYALETGIGRFELTAGLRNFKLEDSTSYSQSGIWIGPEATVASLGGSESGNRKKFSLSYMPSDALNIYALYAEGYRPGGNNGPLPNACSADEYAPQHTERYTSDAIDSYELGVKGAAFDRRLRFAAAAYHIDWTGIRTGIYMPSCGFSFTTNASTARSRGVEFESTTMLGRSTQLTFNASYTDSIMLDDVPALGASKGDDMTMVPKYNGYLALDQQFSLFGRDAFARVDVARYGEYKSHFNVRDEDKSPAYTTVNLSGRMDLTPTSQLSLHVENLLDKEYATYRGARSRSSSRLPLHEIYGAGRTISVRYDFNFR